jgi:hypothetical protein
MNKTTINDKSLPGIELNDYRQGDEEEIVGILSSAFHNKWNDIEYWRWKHCRRPGFNSREVVTASIDGKIVGCFHGATLPFELEPGLVVPMSFDGDFAVLPEYQGRNTPAIVHDLTDRRLKDSGVALRGGFTSKALNERFYRKKFGYVFIPTTSINFRKVIGIKTLRSKVETLGNSLLAQTGFRRAFTDHPVIINFEVEGFTPFHLHLSDTAFHLNDGFSGNAHAYVTAPYNVIMNLSEGIRPFVRSSLFSMLKGQLRIRGIFKLKGFILRLLSAKIKTHL